MAADGNWLLGRVAVHLRASPAFDGDLIREQPGTRRCSGYEYLPPRGERLAQLIRAAPEPGNAVLPAGWFLHREGVCDASVGRVAR